MPDEPTYEQIRGFADKITDKPNQIYGMCLRGKPAGARTWPMSLRW